MTSDSPSSTAPVKRMSIAVQTPDGALPPAEVDVRDVPTTLAELAPFLQHLASSVVDLAIARDAAEGRTVQCRAHCGACCRQLVPLAPLEVFFVIGRLLAMPIEQRRPILEVFDANEKRMQEAGLLQRIRTLGDTADNNRVARAYFELGLFCPFLKDQSCSIHAWRPIACREYNATSSPELCANPFVNKVSTVGLHRRLGASVARFCNAVAGLPLGSVPMPVMFDYYEARKAVAARTWPGIELFERMLRFVLGEAERTQSGEAAALW